MAFWLLLQLRCVYWRALLLITFMLLLLMVLLMLMVFTSRLLLLLLLLYYFFVVGYTILLLSFCLFVVLITVIFVADGVDVVHEICADIFIAALDTSDNEDDDCLRHTLKKLLSPTRKPVWGKRKTLPNYETKTITALINLKVAK